MQIRQSLFQLLQFPECLFQVTLKDANWETSMETRPCQWRCPLSEISLRSLKLWSGCMRLSKCVEKKYIFMVQLHMWGSVPFGGDEIWSAWPCVSLWLQGPERHEEQRELLPRLCGENERCRHLQKNKKTQICCENVRACLSETLWGCQLFCYLARCLGAWWRMPRRLQELVGRGRRVGGVGELEERTKTPQKNMHAPPLHVAAPLE